MHRHWRRVATKLGSAWAALDVHDAATGRWTPLLRPQGAEERPKRLREKTEGMLVWIGMD